MLCRLIDMPRAQQGTLLQASTQEVITVSNGGQARSMVQPVKATELLLTYPPAQLHASLSRHQLQPPRMWTSGPLSALKLARYQNRPHLPRYVEKHSGPTSTSPSPSLGPRCEPGEVCVSEGAITGAQPPGSGL
jgi:hypothetical protein